MPWENLPDLARRGIATPLEFHRLARFQMPSLFRCLAFALESIYEQEVYRSFLALCNLLLFSRCFCDVSRRFEAHKMLHMPSSDNWESFLGHESPHPGPSSKTANPLLKAWYAVKANANTARFTEVRRMVLQ